ncbi:hypothetical protein [Gallaecimonas mangrovi]|uniref:hypothetical protein n=1 Tax=Gallaecimonas mangrovi TaxID=2291597 RepID=UPI000E206497|nr:hypothetical protein [Gallaecimonas mangrovi]
MSYQITNPQEAYERAHTRHSWFDAKKAWKEIKQSSNSEKEQRLAQKVVLTGQAATMLASLNEFDRSKVQDEILYLTYNPLPLDVCKHWNNPALRLIKSRYPFGQYHYLINYTEEPGGKIIVDDIFFDSELFGVRSSAVKERNMMYEIEQSKDSSVSGRFDEEMNNLISGTNKDRKVNRKKFNEFIDNVETSWIVGKAVSNAETDHVAVNGMQNDLLKASWLMGTHIEVAYPLDDFKKYTLFHNPTERFCQDIAECLWDRNQQRQPSNNAAHLAAVLQQCQLAGKVKKWTVHSQGAIIFLRAVQLHMVTKGTPLDKNKVVLHGSGADIALFKHTMAAAGIELIAMRNNPFDIVPNKAGNAGGKSSLKFILSVMLGGPGTSPHTLPFLGIESYYKQLLFLGANRKAKAVKKFINSQGGK